MAGTTPNDNILLSLDQIIAAVNAISTPQEGQLGSLLGIVDKLEELRTLYETQHVAAIVAQNTNFNNLITALNNLNFNCTPDVNLTCPPPTIINNVSVTTTGSEIGTPGDYTDGTTPPDGYTPPDGTVDNRKCKVSNMFADNLVVLIQDFNTHNVPGLAELGINISMTALGGILVGLKNTLVASAAERLGWSEGVLNSMVIGDTDLPSLIADLQANRDDIVCAAYEATSTSEALTATKQILTDYGTTSANINVIDAILTTDYAIGLFVTRSAASEATIDAWPVTTDCAGCGGDQYPVHIKNGTPDSGVYEYISVQGTDNHFVTLYLNSDGTSPVDQAGGTLSIDSLVVYDGAISGCNGATEYRYRPTYDGVWTYQGGPPTFPVADVRVISLCSSSPFRVRLTLS